VRQSQSFGAPNVNLLRERVLLERLELALDEAGGSTQLWSVVTAAWANIRLGEAPREQLSDERSSGCAKWQILVRYRHDIQPGMRFRVVASGCRAERTFRILAASNDDGQRRFLKCICVEPG